MRRVGSWRWKRIGAIALGLLVLLLVVAQVALPRIAASQISSRVGRYGKVEHVSVSAWPAVKLLWGDADSVHVSARSLHLSSGDAAALMWEGRGVAELDMTAREVRMGSLSLTGTSLRKRGAQLEAQALVTASAADTALGAGSSVRLLGSGGGRVRVQVSSSLFGIGASVPAVGEAQNGALVAHAEGLFLEGFRLTLFSDRHVHVEGVGASAAGSGVYRVRMTALLG